MADTLTRNERSERMALIRSKNTGPEITVRKLVHSLGYRYRLHGRLIPGNPDLVFSGTAILTALASWHGCRKAAWSSGVPNWRKIVFETNVSARSWPQKGGNL